MFDRLPELTSPGIFVTGTDTGVGKTVVACALAWQLRRQGGARRISVCKPISTGCRRDREGLVNEDAEALAHFADCRQPLDVINPVRYAAPVAPAVAAEKSGAPLDVEAIGRSLRVLDEWGDAIIVEGVGGIMAPLDGRHTVLDLIVTLRLPVLVVARATLGTLNHTAMTVRLLRDAGCTVAGIVVNGYDTDVAQQVDPSVATNRQWLERMNRTSILATLPRCPAGEVAPQHGRIAPAILDAMAMTYWPQVIGL